MALKVIATNGEAILLADGDVGVSVMPDGSFVVLPVASLIAHSDWEPHSGAIPDLPPAALDEVAAVRRRMQL